MSKEPKSGRPNLASRKDLIVHTYDSFLTSQARIFTLGHYTYHSESSEIETKQKLLFLDDLLTFAITARRLIELTGLRSFSNNQSVGLYLLKRQQLEPALTRSSGPEIGFLTLVNSHSLSVSRVGDEQF